MKSDRDFFRPGRAHLAMMVLRPFLSHQNRTEVVRLLDDLLESRIRAGRPGRAAVQYWSDFFGFVWTALVAKGELDPEEAGLRPWRRPPSLEGLIQSLLADVQFSLRSYASTPLLTLVALGTVSLAIGANTAIFSFADSLLFRPLDIPEPDRVVSVFHQSLAHPDRYSPFSYPDFEGLRDDGNAFVGLAAYSPVSLVLGSGTEALEVDGMIVSENFFSVLGVNPNPGRAFLPEEGRTTGDHPVVVISSSFWHRHFGGEVSPVGAQILLNDRVFRVVGVAPDDTPAPGGFAPPQLWVPLMMHETLLPTFEWKGRSLFNSRGTHWLALVGRLRDGVTLAGAQISLRAIARRQAREYPETNQDWSVAVVPVERARVGPPSNKTPVRTAGLLSVVVGMVLLIACANVANLLLTRAELRRREMAIRLSLGASRFRLIRQVLVESLVLSLAAGGVGVILAVWSMDFLSEFWTTLGRGIPSVRLDARVLFFALVLATATGLVFGLLPAIRASMGGVARGGGRSGTMGRTGGSSGRARDILVGLQVAFSIVLLVGASLMLRTVWNLQSLPLGFDLEGIRVVRGEPSGGPWDPEEEWRTQENLVRAIREMPGIESASLAYVAPLGGGRMANDILWETSEAGGERGRINVDMNVVGVDFFRTMGIRMTLGRAFSDTDGPDAENVAIVNEAMAARLWPDRSPLGQRLWSVNPDHGPDQRLRVVGVVENGRYYRGWQTADRPFLFLPYAQNVLRNPRIVLRDRDGSAPPTNEVLRVIKRVGPSLLSPRVISLTESMAAATETERNTARLLALFGALALAIAGMGIYGVASFSVTRRNHELGVRIALGARASDVGRNVMKESVGPVLVGAATGSLVALALGRFIQGFLYGIHPDDPLTLGAVVGTLTLVGLLASYLPARRATQVDPLRIMTTDG